MPIIKGTEEMNKAIDDNHSSKEKEFKFCREKINAGKVLRINSRRSRAEKSTVQSTKCLESREQPIAMGSKIIILDWLTIQ